MASPRQAERLAQEVLAIAGQIQQESPDRQAIMREYWLDSYRYPAATAKLKDIAEQVRSRNPTMLDLDEVYRRLVLLTVEAILESTGEDSARQRCAESIATLVNFEGTQALHLQLANLSVRRQYDFGGVEFHPILNTGDTTEYQLKYEGPLGHGGPVDAVISYAVVPKAPGMDTKAWRSALDRVEEVLTIIRGIALPTLWGREWRQAGVAGRGFDSGWVVFRRGHRGPWDMSMAASPLLSFMKLDHMVGNYTGAEIRLVEEIYLKEEPTKVERKIVQALAWLGEATFPAKNPSKYARLSVAFETAVGGLAKSLTEIGVTQLLAERTSFLLGTHTEDRMKLHTAVTDLYGIRSKLFHGEAQPVDGGVLARWAMLVWMAVRALLRRSSEIKSVRQLVNWTRRQRYSLPDSVI